MKVTADTNVLVRLVVADDPSQAEAARALFAEARCVALSAVSLAELAWVLRGSYGVSRSDVAAALRALADTENVVVERAAMEAGLAVLEAGGDFADGVIAFEGAWLGGETFASFDRKAVRVLESLGRSALEVR